MEAQVLKSQKHYYWIGGGIWAALMLGGGAFLVVAGLQGEGSGLGGALETEVFSSAEVVTGDLVGASDESESDDCAAIVRFAHFCETCFVFVMGRRSETRKAIAGNVP